MMNKWQLRRWHGKKMRRMPPKGSGVRAPLRPKMVALTHLF